MVYRCSTKYSGRPTPPQQSAHRVITMWLVVLRSNCDHNRPTWCCERALRGRINITLMAALSPALRASRFSGLLRSPLRTYLYTQGTPLRPRSHATLYGVRSISEYLPRSSKYQTRLGLRPCSPTLFMVTVFGLRLISTYFLSHLLKYALRSKQTNLHVFTRIRF